MSGFIKKYEECIREEIASIEEEIPRAKKETHPVAPDNAIGRLTRMEAIGAKAIAEAQLGSLKARFVRLKGLLERIEKKDPNLGLCTECGDEIARARLLARPESLRCVECLNDQA